MTNTNITIKTPLTGETLLNLFVEKLGGKAGSLLINTKVVSHFILHPPRGNTVIHAFDWWENQSEHRSIKLYVKKED